MNQGVKGKATEREPIPGFQVPPVGESPKRRTLSYSPCTTKKATSMRSLFAFNRMGLLLNLGREELTVQAGFRPLGKGDGGM